MKAIQPVYDAIEQSMRFYSSQGSDYSVTQLIDPPRIVQLRKRHGHKVEINIDNSVSPFIGNGVHAHFEYCLKKVFDADKQPVYQLEQRLFDKILDRKVSGAYDILYRNTHMFDIKCTSVYKVILDPEFEHWTKQQNFYAYLIRKDGRHIDSINIIACFLDWREMMMVRDKNYPRKKIMQYPLKLWTYEEQEKMFMDRLKLHIAAESMKDHELPECTREEMWQQDDKYAVMKKPTAARASRVFPKESEAKDYLKTCQDKDEKGWKSGCVEARIGERKRCEKWCPVNQFCKQYIDYIFARREQLKLKKEGKTGDVIE